MGGTLSNCSISIEAHFDMDWKRGHTGRCIVEDCHTEAHGSNATEDNERNDLVDILISNVTK